jgi:hypothetical protein
MCEHTIEKLDVGHPFPSDIENYADSIMLTRDVKYEDFYMIS